MALVIGVVGVGDDAEEGLEEAEGAVEVFVQDGSVYSGDGG